MIRLSSEFPGFVRHATNSLVRALALIGFVPGLTAQLASRRAVIVVDWSARNRMLGLSDWQIAIVVLFAVGLLIASKRGWLQKPKPRIAWDVVIASFAVFIVVRTLLGPPGSTQPNVRVWGIIPLLLAFYYGWDAWYTYRRHRGKDR